MKGIQYEKNAPHIRKATSISNLTSRNSGKKAGQRTHTHTHNRFMAHRILSRTTQVNWYQKKHSHTQTYHGHQSSLICFLHLLRSMASSLFNLHAWQSFFTISLQVFFGQPLGLAPFTSYYKHFFTQSLSSFCSTCSYHCNLFCCSTEIMSPNPSLSINPLLRTLSCSLILHIHLTILISARWSANSFFFLTGQVWLPCNVLLRCMCRSRWRKQIGMIDDHDECSGW